MKRLLVLMFIVTMSSCSNSENTKNANPSNILGRWYVIQLNQDPAEWPLGECKKLGYLEFYSNGSYQEIGGYDDNNNTCLTRQNQGEWSIVDGVLVLNDMTENYIYYIEKFEISGNRLTLYRPPSNPPYNEIFIEIYEKR